MIQRRVCSADDSLLLDAPGWGRALAGLSPVRRRAFDRLVAGVEHWLFLRRELLRRTQSELDDLRLENAALRLELEFLRRAAR